MDKMQLTQEQIDAVGRILTEVVKSMTEILAPIVRDVQKTLIEAGLLDESGELTTAAKELIEKADKRLPELEENILADLHSDSEWCTGYRGITGGNSPENVKAIKHLKELGYIDFFRGLMTEDGEVAGSGWCRSVKGNAYVEEFEL